MVRWTIILSLSAAAIAGAGAATTALRAQTTAPYYVVIDVAEALDPDAYVKAVQAVEPNATLSAGGKFLIRTNKASALDGGDPPSRFVVIGFENEQKARNWYASPAIAGVNAVRAKVMKSRAFLAEGLPN
jgi:uncharacterized protein (DUF1330 family)